MYVPEGPHMYVIYTGKAIKLVAKALTLEGI